MLTDQERLYPVQATPLIFFLGSAFLKRQSSLCSAHFLRCPNAMKRQHPRSHQLEAKKR